MSCLFDLGHGDRHVFIPPASALIIIFGSRANTSYQDQTLLSTIINPNSNIHQPVKQTLYYAHTSATAA